MALIVTDNSVRQINAALLSLEKKIGETNSEKAQDKQVVQMELKNVQYNFMAPLYQSGNSVSINTTGTWEGNARSATTAEHAITADNVEHADTATSADTATTATTAETANKVKNALTVNGKTYDGSEAVDAGVQTVENGGTGATTAKDAFMNLANGLSEDNGPLDTEYMAYKNTGGTHWGLYTLSTLWNYIKNKISSVLGLTKDNYGGKADTAGTADKVVSEGANTMWVYGRDGAICKTTVAGESNGWKALASIKTSSGSIEIGNLSGEDYIRVVYSSDADVNSGNNNVTQLLYIRRGNIEAPHEFIANSAKALSKMVIPIGAPSSLEDGCIWIER